MTDFDQVALFCTHQEWRGILKHGHFFVSGGSACSLPQGQEARLDWAKTLCRTGVGAVRQVSKIG
jgi:hypothetical protein